MAESSGRQLPLEQVIADEQPNHAPNITSSIMDIAESCVVMPTNCNHQYMNTKPCTFGAEFAKYASRSASLSQDQHSKFNAENMRKMAENENVPTAMCEDINLHTDVDTTEDSVLVKKLSDNTLTTEILCNKDSEQHATQESSFVNLSVNRKTVDMSLCEETSKSASPEMENLQARASHEETDRKNEVRHMQNLVDQFIMLDTANKAIFFNCVVPSMKEEELRYLAFVISTVNWAVIKESITKKRSSRAVRRSARVTRISKKVIVSCEKEDIADDSAGKLDEDLVCIDCHRKFSSESALLSHAKQCFKTRHKCDICTHSFAGKKTLQKHIATSHKYQHPNRKADESERAGNKSSQSSSGDEQRCINRQTYTCSYCNKVFMQKQYLLDHVVVHTGDTPHRCTQCLASFAYRSALWRHRKKHSGERPHSCIHCHKAFVDKQTLVAHERTHTGERPFICDRCGAAFTQKSNLRTHRNTQHLGQKREKSVMCDRCPKVFKDQGTLRRHYVVHTGEKPWACVSCPRRFARKTDLAVHQRTHTGERPFKCGICEKSFSDSSNLKVHERTHSQSGFSGCGREVCPQCQQTCRNLRELRKHRKLCSGVVMAVEMGEIEKEQQQFYATSITEGSEQGRMYYHL